MLKPTTQRTALLTRRYTSTIPSNYTISRKSYLIGLLGLATAANIYLFLQLDKHDKDTFKIATLNVNLWKDTKDSNSTEQISKIINELDLDVLALQLIELDTKVLNKFSTSVRMPNIAVGPGDLANFGNAVLSKHAILKQD